MAITVVHLWQPPSAQYTMCPRCGCCSWVDVDTEYMLCAGRCDEGGLHEEDRGDGEIDYGIFERYEFAYCAGCNGDAHGGSVCPELTVRGIA